MADLVRQYFPGLPIINKPRDSLTPERGTLNIDKARRLLGYHPQYPLETGFARYIKWYQELATVQPDLFGEA
jgi:nucleoside-diphosphate-sugar epimerase